MYSAICETLFGVVVLHTSMVELEEGGTSALEVYVHSAICETYSV